MKKIFIVGAGGHAGAVLDALLSSDSQYDQIIFIGEAASRDICKNFEIRRGLNEVNIHEQGDYFVAVGDNSTRMRINKEVEKSLPNLDLITIIHKTAYASPKARIFPGVFLGGKSHVGPYTQIGKCALINTGALVDHDCLIGDYSSVAPAACLGGGVSLGNASIVGLGASVSHNVKVGANSMVAGGAFLNINVADNQVFMGVPAKFVSFRKNDQSYL